MPFFVLLIASFMLLAPNPRKKQLYIYASHQKTNNVVYKEILES